MDEKTRINFEKLLGDARDRLDTLKEYYGVLAGRVDAERGTSELSQWITDVFADKVFATHVELQNVLAQIPNSRDNEVTQYCDALVESLIVLATAKYDAVQLKSRFLPNVESYLRSLITATETQFVLARRYMYQKGWTGLSNIKPIEPLDIQRKKYVSARENLAKARECLTDNVEDVTIHLRSAIDLSIKERFGFLKIHPMAVFIKDADKFEFPLPSYDLIYHLFDEGSSRLHAGKGNTGFEAKQMVKIVSEFIDSLETIIISQEEIDDFKSKSKAVE